MRQGLIIPIFFQTEHQDTQKEMGIDIDISQSELKDVLFFDITGIVRYTEHKKYNYSGIYAGGDFFISPLTIQTLRKKIDEYWGI